MFYYALLLLFQNEMGPVNELEFGIVCAFLSASVMFNALVFGDIYTVWETLT